MKLAPGTPLRVRLACLPNRIISVGRLALDRGRAALEYDPDFIASGLTINPRLGQPGRELVWAAEPRLFDGLHGVFADSLPDAWGRELMRRRVIARGVNPSTLNALDHLAIIGRRGMGALVYEPAFATTDVDEIDLDALSREALDVLAGRETGAVLTTLEELGDSSGGARPKILVAIDASGNLRAGTDAIPPGYEAWIVKFRAARDRPDAGQIEATYADMARAAGIDIAPTTLLSSRSRVDGYFATRRFDRGPGGQRLHVVSVAGLLETRWEVPSIDYHGLLNAVRYVTRRQRDVEQMIRRMVFNVAANNRDDHTKQHAFLMDATGAWRLAPAYDLTFSGGPGGEHYLTVEGLGAQIARKEIRALAARHSLKKADADVIIDEVIDAVAQFDRIAASYGVSASSRNEIGGVLGRQARELEGSASAKMHPRSR